MKQTSRKKKLFIPLFAVGYRRYSFYSPFFCTFRVFKRGQKNAAKQEMDLVTSQSSDGCVLVTVGGTEATLTLQFSSRGSEQVPRGI